MEFETLETERLLLKKMTPEMFEQLFQNYKDEEIMQILGISSQEELIKQKEKSKGGYKTYDRTILAFLIVLKNTNETIGRCGYHNWYLEHQKAEIGYVLHKEENRRKGYMNEAITAVLEYGFNVLKLNRIEACIAPDNISSLRLIEKHGFVQEGYLRQHFIRDGEIQDSKIYSLLKEDVDANNDDK